MALWNFLLQGFPFQGPFHNRYRMKGSHNHLITNWDDPPSGTNLYLVKVRISGL